MAVELILLRWLWAARLTVPNSHRQEQQQARLSRLRLKALRRRGKNNGSANGNGGTVGDNDRLAKFANTYRTKADKVNVASLKIMVTSFVVTPMLVVLVLPLLNDPILNPNAGSSLSLPLFYSSYSSAASSTSPSYNVESAAGGGDSGAGDDDPLAIGVPTYQTPNYDDFYQHNLKYYESPQHQLLQQVHHNAKANANTRGNANSLAIDSYTPYGGFVCAITIGYHLWLVFHFCSEMIFLGHLFMLHQALLMLVHLVFLKPFMMQFLPCMVIIDISTFFLHLRWFYLLFPQALPAIVKVINDSVLVVSYLLLRVGCTGYVTWLVFKQGYLNWELIRHSAAGNLQRATFNEGFSFGIGNGNGNGNGNWWGFLSDNFNSNLGCLVVLAVCLVAVDLLNVCWFSLLLQVIMYDNWCFWAGRKREKRKAKEKSSSAHYDNEYVKDNNAKDDNNVNDNENDDYGGKNVNVNVNENQFSRDEKSNYNAVNFNNGGDNDSYFFDRNQPNYINNDHSSVPNMNNNVVVANDDDSYYYNHNFNYPSYDDKYVVGQQGFTSNPTINVTSPPQSPNNFDNFDSTFDGNMNDGNNLSQNIDGISNNDITNQSADAAEAANGRGGANRISIFNFHEAQHLDLSESQYHDQDQDQYESQGHGQDQYQDLLFPTEVTAIARNLNLSLNPQQLQQLQQRQQGQDFTHDHRVNDDNDIDNINNNNNNNHNGTNVGGPSDAVISSGLYADDNASDMDSYMSNES